MIVHQGHEATEGRISGDSCNEKAASQRRGVTTFEEILHGPCLGVTRKVIEVTFLAADLIVNISMIISEATSLSAVVTFHDPAPRFISGRSICDIARVSSIYSIRHSLVADSRNNDYNPFQRSPNTNCPRWRTQRTSPSSSMRPCRIWSCRPTADSSLAALMRTLEILNH